MARTHEELVREIIESERAMGLHLLPPEPDYLSMHPHPGDEDD